MGAALRRGPSRPARRGARALIEIEDLTVRFGGVTPLDGMTVRFEQGTCGLIGPNGAGKTTFFNVLSGFVAPASGRITADGDDLLAMPHFRRARWGVRRTFQTEQAIEELSVAANVALAHEHSRLGSRASRRDDVLAALAFVGLGEVDPDAKVGTLGLASGASSRSRARSSESPASSSSTSRRPACPTTRPSTSGTSSAASPSTPARW